MNIGAVVQHLGKSQITYNIVREINKISNYYYNTVIFFEQLVNSHFPAQCATMCVNELVNYHGILITSNLYNTKLAISLTNPNTTKVIFYVWDLEWLRPNQNNYLYNFEIYNKAPILIARSRYHAKAITNYANRTPIVMENFSLKEILEFSK